ncbi:MAG: zinc ribbon domain-containing protein [Candidatus Bathyarchaeia archaeon]
MRGGALSVGSLFLTIGLIAYLFGLLAIFHQTFLMDYLLKAFPNIQLMELMGVLLQLFGIILGVTGFALLISGIVKIQLEGEMREFEPYILSRIEDRVSNVLVKYKASISLQAPTTIHVCKYCNAQLTGNEVFCPACGKAQK